MNRFLKIALFVSLMFVCQVSFAQQRNGIFIDDYMTRPEITVAVPVKMVNNFNVCGFQCDITLPEGFDIAKNEKGKYDFKLSNRADDHFVTSNFKNGVYRMVVVSFTNSYFTGNSGVLFTIPLYTKPGVLNGKYKVTIDNIEITDVEYYERPEGDSCFIHIDALTGVNTVDAEAVSIKSADGKIHISGAEIGSLINVYDLTGRIVCTRVTEKGIEIVDGLVPGIYMVQASRVCKKVVII